MSVVATSVRRVTARMTAEQRREQLLTVASRLFVERGYRDTSTAQLAAAASVTEPVIYRHFRGKRDLYLACVSRAWEDAQERLRAAIESEADPAEWTVAMARVGLDTVRSSGRAQLWLQLHGEAHNDPEISSFAATNLREVHDFARAIVERAQRAGGVAPDLNPDVEAWIILSIALMVGSVGRVGLAGDVDIDGIVASRQAWLRSGFNRARER